MKGKRETVYCYISAAAWAILAVFWILMYFGVISGSMTGSILTGIAGLGFVGIAVAWLVRAIKRTKHPPEEE